MGPFFLVEMQKLKVERNFLEIEHKMIYVRRF